MADYYKIKLNWNGGKWDKTQKGAYTTAQQAIEHCTQDLIDQGYKVFSPTGKVIYPIYYHELAELMFKDGVIVDRQYWTDVFEGKVIVDNKWLQIVIKNYSEQLNKTNITTTVKPDVENNGFVEDNIVENVEDVKDDNIVIPDIQIPTVELPKSITELKYDGVSIYRVPTSMFKVKWWDKPKRNSTYSTCFSSGYFGNFAEPSGVKFTLPSGNLIADIDVKNIHADVLKYLYQRKIENDKLYYPANLNTDAAFRTAKISTLCIDQQNKASIIKLNNFSGTNYKYAVSGAPVISNGQYIANYTVEGWDNSIVRNTTHILVGTRRDEDTFIYIFPYTTTTKNCFISKELYNKFKDFGFNNLLKLDGGGSAYAKINGKVVANTSENRPINTLIVIE